jgi:hypothetical protein
MHAGSSQHMVLDQRRDRGECHTRMANQVSQGRQTDIHSFAHRPLGLTVQRLVLAARHCPRTNGGQGSLSKATIAIRCGPAHPRGMAWKGAVRRGDLALEDRLILLTWLIFSQVLQVNFSRTVWSKEGLDHRPLAGDDFQRLGDVAAHLHDVVRATARTAGRGLDHHPLTRQVCREGSDRGSPSRQHPRHD